MWRLAKATGTRPHELLGRRLSSREALGFDLTVMRGYDKFRQMRFGLAAQQAAAGDDLGIGRIYQALSLIYLDD